jgi:hypothetical protein
MLQIVEIRWDEISTIYELLKYDIYPIHRFSSSIGKSISVFQSFFEKPTSMTSTDISWEQLLPWYPQIH